MPLRSIRGGTWIRVLTMTLLSAAMAQAWNIVGVLTSTDPHSDTPRSSASALTLAHGAAAGVQHVRPWLGMLAGSGLRRPRGVRCRDPRHAAARTWLRAGDARLWRGDSGELPMLNIADRSGPGGLQCRSSPPNSAASGSSGFVHMPISRSAALVVVTTELRGHREQHRNGLSIHKPNRTQKS